MYSTVLDNLKNKHYKAIRADFEGMNEADIAALLTELYTDKEIAEHELTLLYRLLNKDMAADVFAYMDSELQIILVNSFSDTELGDVLDDLYLDDTVDMIEEMPANLVSRILQTADSEKRDRINRLLKYPKDSAGAVMTTEYLFFEKDYTVKEALDKIRHVGAVKETINSLYVTERRKLIGVLSILDLLTHDEDDLIADIMDTNVISVDTLEDKEIVAKTFEKYDFLALPVVDNESRLVGIVTIDDAMDVLQEEATEDFTKMAAVLPTEDSYFKTSVLVHAKNRIVWLLVLMLSATLTGAVITKYEAAFAAVPILVSFLPMLTDTGGNCGSQTSTMIIRGMSIGEIRLKDFFRVLFKEFRIALVCAFVLAVVNGIRIIIMYHNNPNIDGVKLAVTVSGAVMATVVISKLIACALPMAAKKLRLDPAIMASPLITTIVDVCSTMIFFMLATMVFGL
jgi:magnesium transporter